MCVFASPRANDTANATAAFQAIFTGYRDGLYGCESDSTEWWVLFVAGSFVFLGIVTVGYRVIETVGKGDVCSYMDSMLYSSVACVFGVRCLVLSCLVY